MEHVTLSVSASELPKKDIIGWADPYCKVLINGDLKYTTEIVQNSKEAVWSEFLLHNLHPNDTVRFEVCDHDKHSDDDDIGSYQTTWSELFSDSLPESRRVTRSTRVVRAPRGDRFGRYVTV